MQSPKKQKRRCDETIKSAIWDVLNNHYGIDHAISAQNLLDEINSVPNGKRIDAREIRYCISQMRKEGNLICSLSGSNPNRPKVSGYFIPATFSEYKEYREFHTSYAKDIFETIRAMDKEARLTFIYDYQPPLFPLVEESS